MNIKDMTIRELEEIALLLRPPAQYIQLPFRLEQAYLICTVNKYWLGKLKRIYGNFLVLTHASWIANTGRLNETFSKGILSEYEVAPKDLEICVAIDSIIDAWQWNFELPTETQ